MPVFVAGEVVTAAKMNALFPLGPDYTAYVPTIAAGGLGNGTIVGRYIRIGKHVHAWIHFSLGSTSTVGTTPTFTLPVNASASYVALEEMIGTAYIRAAGSQYPGWARLASASTVTPAIAATAGAYGTIQGLTASIPGVFATGDDLSLNLLYEGV